MAVKQAKRRRDADSKEGNPATAGPPALTQVASSSIIVRSKKIGKSGAIYLSGLPEGANVNVATVDQQTYLVSSRPADELRALTASIPKTPPSPFAALSAELRGQRHDAIEPRVRSAYSGPIGDLDLPEHEDRGLDLTRTKRRR